MTLYLGLWYKGAFLRARPELSVLPRGQNDGFHGVVIMPHPTQRGVRLREAAQLKIHDDGFHGDDLIPWY